MSTVLEMENNLFENSNMITSTDDSSSSSDESESSTNTSDDSSISSSGSDEDYSNYDINELMAEIESRIHPHFREIAAAIRKDDAYSLNVALDNFRGNIDENLIDGDTALHYSCKEKSPTCFKLLLERGANIESRNDRGAIPLHKACVYGLFKIVNIIFNYITNKEIIKKMVESVNQFGDRPLHEAVVGRNINIIKLLLNIGATNIGGINKMVNSVDLIGETPLHHAATYGNRKVVKLLLEFGASTEIQNLNGKIPSELAKPNSEIKRLFEGNPGN